MWHRRRFSHHGESDKALLAHTIKPALFFALAFCLTGGTVQAAERVLFFSPSLGTPSQEAKYRGIAEAARAEGITIDSRSSREVKPEVATELFGQYRAVIFDSLAGPESLVSLADQYGRAVLAHPGLKAVAVGSPSSVLTRNVPSEVALAARVYLKNGGRENFRRLSRFIRVRILGAGGEVEPAVVFPEQAAYHPDAPSLVFPDTESYFAWRPPMPDQPIVAVIFHQNYLAADALAAVDATIRGLEAQGLAVLPYYTDIQTDYLGEAFLMKDGKPRASLIITHQVMILNAEKVRAQAAKIGLPILQALTYSKGDVAAWRADKEGLTPTQLPMHMVMPEIIGYADPLIVAAYDKDTRNMVVIPEQIESLAAKAAAMVRLGTVPNADKRLAVLFYNYPPGVTNLGAAFLDIPASLARLTEALRDRGYDAEPKEARFFEKNARSMLEPFYVENLDAKTDTLLRDGFAALYPVSSYRIWYDRLPADTRERVEARWGTPEQSRMTVVRNGERHFVIPRLQSGKITVLPQPRRSERENAKDESLLYHDTKIPVNHAYLATYLWLREAVGIDALIHLGTHGTQEWMPGKERGLSIYDDAYLPLSDTPVLYPYIADNLAEGIQAKRRGRAILISHLTPPFAVTGTFGELTEITRLINEYETAGVESLKARTFTDILTKADKNHLTKDMGWDRQRARKEPKQFVAQLQDFLMGLSNQAQPLGSHVLGTLPKREHMISTLALVLGKEFLVAADGEGATAARDYQLFTRSRAAQLLAEHVLDGKDLSSLSDPALRFHLERARIYYEQFKQSDEIGALLAGLEGRYVPTGYGGDVVRNPDLLPTGRNMYGFDPAKVPTRSAWETGKKLAEQTLAEYRARHGRYPEKLAFNLWSLETMRHFGVMEAQILALMGVKPVWNEEGAARDTRAYGRDDIADVEVISAAELQRPRIDVVMSVTGLYRDTFPNTMKWLSLAVKKVAALDEADNVVRRNTARLRDNLITEGLETAEAERLSTVRVFSSQVGQYGSGAAAPVIASNTWDKEDKIARNYLAVMGYYYSDDPTRWGEKRAGLDLYGKNLAGSEAVLFSRSTNLYGLLTSDDPFGYFGALSLAVRHLSGRTPESFIANLRNADRPAMEPTARFMAKELKGRQFHPQWIAAQRDQGYAGALNVLESVENFWGWQVVDPTAVRTDQWQAFHNIYVRDALKLGTREWFEQSNPQALAQVAERMLEANRKGYWRADAQTLKELTGVVEDAIARHDFKPLNDKILPFVEQLKAHGYGLDLAAPVSAAPPTQSTLAQSGQVEGMLLTSQTGPSQALPLLPWLALALILAATLAGALTQQQYGREWSTVPLAAWRIR